MASPNAGAGPDTGTGVPLSGTPCAGMAWCHVRRIDVLQAVAGENVRVGKQFERIERCPGPDTAAL